MEKGQFSCEVEITRRIVWLKILIQQHSVQISSKSKLMGWWGTSAPSWRSWGHIVTTIYNNTRIYIYIYIYIIYIYIYIYVYIYIITWLVWSNNALKLIMRLRKSICSEIFRTKKSQRLKAVKFFLKKLPLVKHATHQKAESLRVASTSKLDNTVNGQQQLYLRYKKSCILQNGRCFFIFTTVPVHTTTPTISTKNLFLFFSQFSPPYSTLTF